MRKLDLWMVKHRRAAFWLTIAFLIVVYGTLFQLLRVPGWVRSLFVALSVLLTYARVDLSLDRVLQQPVRICMESGDPGPLLEESINLLSCRLQEVKRQYVLIVHCAALREIGEIARALELMQSIHIDKCASMPPVTKYMYYLNLSDLYNLQGDLCLAELYYQKAMEIYHDLPDNSLKRKQINSAQFAAAEANIRNGHYQEVFPVLLQVEPVTLADRVEKELLWGMACARLNDTETARIRLNFVVANGTRLHAVRQAREELARLDG